MTDTALREQGLIPLYEEIFWNYNIKVYRQTPDKDWTDFYNMSEEQQDLNDQFAPDESKGEYRYEVLLEDKIVESDDICMGDFYSTLTNARWDVFHRYKKVITDEKKREKIYDSIYKITGGSNGNDIKR
tara:strand:+ start:2729 stop:3115 length:387 start_codon:yes stop_codon:yes gene_type:complete